MFYILSKLSSFVENPLFWIIGLFVLAFALKNRRWTRRCFWSAVSLYLILGNGALITRAELLWSEKYIDQWEQGKVYDYALIQGGFGGYNPVTGRTQLYPAAERLIEPVRLYHSGKVKKLFITGDGSFSDQKYPESKQAFLRYILQMGVLAEDIILDSQAQNTRQSALRTSELLGQDFQSENSLLVTSATHMRRTLKCYEKVGLHPVPYPTSIPKPYDINITNFGLSAKNLDRWQILFHEWIGLLMYRMVGYA